MVKKCCIEFCKNESYGGCGISFHRKIFKLEMEPPPGRRFIDGCIVFNGLKSVFYSGQVLEGKVNFELNSPLNILAIDVIFRGEGNVEWTEVQVETYGHVRRDKLLKYVGREEYFNYVQRLSQGPSTLPAGSHSISFSYLIPYTCPSSFKGEKGQVTYSVTVYIIHQDGVTKETIETEFDVIDPLNLNTGSPDIKNPLVMEFDQMMGCQCFFASKPLGVTVRLPAQGLYPGQTVPVAVSVRNTTSVELNKIIFAITSRERYRSQQPASEYEPPEEVLTTLKRGPILSHTTRDYEFELPVPEFLAPNMDQCSIIDVGYFFRVTIKLSGCNEDMEDEAEICIGLVPLGESLDLKNHPIADKLPIGPIPDPNSPNNVPPINQTFVQNQNTVQGFPASPIPYSAYPANLGDKSNHGSKNSLVGPYEIGFRAPNVNTSVNPTLPQPVAGYPYPGLPQGQSPPYPKPQPSAPPAY